MTSNSSKGKELSFGYILELRNPFEGESAFLFHGHYLVAAIFLLRAEERESCLSMLETDYCQHSHTSQEGHRYRHHRR